MREPIGIVATLRELERRNKPTHYEEDMAEVCKGYHTDPRDPAFDPPGHSWRYKEAGDGSTWRVCKGCGTGDEI